MPEPKLSALELRIMSEFWSRGACSIREIHEAVAKRDKPAYTTVQTMIYRLEAKGAVGGRVVELRRLDQATVQSRHDFGAGQRVHRCTHALEQVN